MRNDALKIVNREQLVSCMNNTKWHRLLEEINAIPVSKRVKYIDSDQMTSWQGSARGPLPGYVEFSGGPVPFCFIEWLEIKKKANGYGKLATDKVTDRTAKIRAVLQIMNLDVEETDLSFVVRGYRRPSK
ncbi:MAG: DUF6678 family protein [Planctomycetota bacterium]